MARVHNQHLLRGGLRPSRLWVREVAEAVRVDHDHIVFDVVIYVYINDETGDVFHVNHSSPSVDKHESPCDDERLRIEWVVRPRTADDYHNREAHKQHPSQYRDVFARRR